MALGLMLSGCGPSAAQVGAARAAVYKVPESTAFELAVAATRSKFKIAEADPRQGMFLTQGKWYSPDGQPWSAGAGDTVMVTDGSLMVALLVAIVPLPDDTVRVDVTPYTEKHVSGQSQNDVLKPNDPRLPGWVTGKADALAIEIHAALKDYEVVATTQAPATGSAPQPTPE